MKVRKVLSRKNLPTKLPLMSSVTCLLALQYWNAPQWLYGVMGSLYAIVWIFSIYNILSEKQTDLLNE